MAYTSTNPYLEARCEYVLAKLALIANPDGEDETWSPLVDAQALGSQDAARAHETGEDIPVPAFFTDVPELKREWLDGWNRYDELVDMQNCSGCNNERGDPCPCHG